MNHLKGCLVFNEILAIGCSPSLPNHSITRNKINKVNKLKGLISGIENKDFEKILVM